MTLTDLPDGSELDWLRDKFSRELFGAGYRAEVGLAIAGLKQVCKKDLEDGFRDAMGNPPGRSSIGGEFDLLLGLGLLVPVATADGSRKKYVAPVEGSAYWDLCRELRDRAASGSTP